jgi:hypothetical protein
LARDLSMTVAELFERVHPTELTWWMAFYNIEAEDEAKAMKEAKGKKD